MPNPASNIKAIQLKELLNTPSTIEGNAYIAYNSALFIYYRSPR